MSWKTLLFFASICTVANPLHLSACEPSLIKPSSTPPVIVDASDDQRYNVHDRFIVKRGGDERRVGALASLFPRINETVTTADQRPNTAQKRIESKKATPRQTTSKPKLTVVVRSEPKPEELVDDAVSENVVKTPPASMHHHHRHHHHRHNYHVARHNRHVHRHDNRHQTGTKTRHYGRPARRHVR